MPDDTRDRVIALESKLTALLEKVAGSADKVDEMHNIFVQAKGVRWLIYAVMLALGGIAANLKAIAAWMGRS